jgi:hypothetical protein
MRARPFLAVLTATAMLGSPGIVIAASGHPGQTQEDTQKNKKKDKDKDKDKKDKPDKEKGDKRDRDAEAREHAERGPNDEIGARFRSWDADGNNFLTPGEWRGAPAFNVADRNNDGRVTMGEFRQSQRPAPTSGAVPRNDGRRDVKPMDLTGKSVAFRAGYERGVGEGRQAGREDRQAGKWDLDGQRELERADSGYTGSIGPLPEYQSGYRAGFRFGYADGFGPRR